MVSRRSHTKSRLGCITCKQRRVKCDEQGPPCGPCALRSAECKYSKAVAPKSSPSTTVEHRSNESNGTSTTPGTLAGSEAWSSSVRQLELELLHRWTTVTYKSYCGTVDEEYHNWQILVPRLALKYDYLLYGLFAMAALEIGAFSDSGVSQEYIDAALEYQNRASRGLREELSHADLTTIPQEQHQALWAVSSMLMVLALAIPPFTTPDSVQHSMLEHITTFVELEKGLIVIVAGRITTHKEDPLLCNYREWDELELLPIPTETQAAIDRLKELNEEIYGAERIDRGIPELKAMNYHAACRKAIFFLQECFAKCSEPNTRAYGLVWPLASGQDFVTALNDLQPVPLLILMHWGVFLEQQSYGIWYVERVGKFLVGDLSEGLLLHENQKIRDATVWARAQVGLD